MSGSLLPHLDPALRRCSNCAGRGHTGRPWGTPRMPNAQGHDLYDCGPCKSSGFVPKRSKFAIGGRS